MSSEPDSSSPAEPAKTCANNYRPEPIDTSSVQMPPEVDDLTEKLSRNVHENWAKRRLAEGWRWGAKRDDTRKLHPSLVPYDNLSESEKAYDRATAMQTLKVILSLGFRITKT